MKILLWLSLVIMLLVLTACAPVAAMPIEIQPTSTETPEEATKTSTPTETPTETPTSTPTSIPTLEGLSIPVPDPRVTNPELFDITKTDSLVLDFAKDFGLDPADVIAKLQPELETPTNGAVPFMVMRTPEGIALMMATQKGESEEWIWQEATPGSYWFAQQKVIGVYMDGSEFDFIGNLNILKIFFSDGMVATSGQVRPNANRPPSRALGVAREAQSNNMSLFFHYIVEPGKLPKDVNTSNIDTWLNTRFDGVIKVLKDTKTDGHPMYLCFNEAWEGNLWNEESNPLRSKYGNDKWVEEYIFQMLSKFVNAGLVPNKDYIIVFNDGLLFNQSNRQDTRFKFLSEARSNAFNRLVSDQNMATKLKEMGIDGYEDIDIVLGVQVHTKLGQNIDDGNFVPPPTDAQITNLSKKFESLGGILLTEFNPNGTTEQQELFVKQMFSLLKTDPNLKGILLWNIFNPDDSSDIFSIQKLGIFDDNGTPTKLFFDLLGE